MMPFSQCKHVGVANRKSFLPRHVMSIVLFLGTEASEESTDRKLMYGSGFYNKSFHDRFNHCEALVWPDVTTVDSQGQGNIEQS